jgi:hypothetical protein
LIVLAISSLAAVFGSRSKRAVYAGFAAFGWCYLTLAFGPWFRDSVRPHLPTTWSIEKFPQRPLEILRCPDDVTVTPSAFKQPPYNIGGFQRWPPYDGTTIFIPTIGLRERIGHSLFAIIVATTGSILAPSLAAWQTRPQQSRHDRVTALPTRRREAVRSSMRLFVSVLLALLLLAIVSYRTDL